MAKRRLRTETAKRTGPYRDPRPMVGRISGRAARGTRGSTCQTGINCFFRTSRRSLGRSRVRASARKSRCHRIVWRRRNPLWLSLLRDGGTRPRWRRLGHHRVTSTPTEVIELGCKGRLPLPAGAARLRPPPEFLPHLQVRGQSGLHLITRGVEPVSYS